MYMKSMCHLKYYMKDEHIIPSNCFLLCKKKSADVMKSFTEAVSSFRKYFIILHTSVLKSLGGA